MLENLLISCIQVYSWVLFAYVMLSWFPANHGLLADINHVLAQVCEPYLKPFRKLIPPIGGIMDVTPIVAFFVLQLATGLLSWLL